MLYTFLTKENKFYKEGRKTLISLLVYKKRIIQNLFFLYKAIKFRLIL